MISTDWGRRRAHGLDFRSQALESWETRATLDDMAAITAGPFKSIIPVIPVPDPGATVTFYVEKLGFLDKWTFGDPPNYAGATQGNLGVHFYSGEPIKGASIYVVTDKVDELYAALQAAGVTVDAPIGDRHYGMRDFTVLDLNGMQVCFGQDLPHEHPH